MRQLVLEGTREQVQRDLQAAQRRGEVVEPPTLVKRLDGGRFRVIVPARVDVPQADPPPATRPRRGTPAVRLDGHKAIMIGAVAAGVVMAGACYGAGVAGWGVGALKNLGAAALALGLVVVVVVVAIGELRDGGGR